MYTLVSQNVKRSTPARKVPCHVPDNGFLRWGERWRGLAQKTTAFTPNTVASEGESVLLSDSLCLQQKEIAQERKRRKCAETARSGLRRAEALTGLAPRRQVALCSGKAASRCPTDPVRGGASRPLPWPPLLWLRSHALGPDSEE